ncbi:unnamed protein product [Closterium sp. NIES-54]
MALPYAGAIHPGVTCVVEEGLPLLHGGERRCQSTSTCELSVAAVDRCTRAWFLPTPLSATLITPLFLVPSLLPTCATPLVALPCPACHAALLAACCPALPVAPPCRPSAALPCPSRRPASRAPPCPACRAALWPHAALPWPSRRPAGSAPFSPACRITLPATAFPCPGCAPLFPSRAPPCPALRASLVLVRRPACVLPYFSRATLLCPLRFLSMF